MRWGSPQLRAQPDLPRSISQEHLKTEPLGKPQFWTRSLIAHGTPEPKDEHRQKGAQHDVVIRISLTHITGHVCQRVSGNWVGIKAILTKALHLFVLLSTLGTPKPKQELLSHKLKITRKRKPHGVGISHSKVCRPQRLHSHENSV